MTGRVRRAGGRWRLLAHETLPHGASGEAHHVNIPGTEFDELVVGQWLHVEQMGSGSWWMAVGGVTVHVRADRGWSAEARDGARSRRLRRPGGGLYLRAGVAG